MRRLNPTRMGAGIWLPLTLLSLLIACGGSDVTPAPTTTPTGTAAVAPATTIAASPTPLAAATAANPASATAVPSSSSASVTAPPTTTRAASGSAPAGTRAAGSVTTPNRPGQGLSIPGVLSRDVTYCTMDGLALTMDIYQPQPAPKQPAPTVLFVHGGGWTQGDKTAPGNLVDFAALVLRGYVVASIDYRLAPKYQFPAMLYDTKCAVRFLRAKADTYNIDPNRIGAMGDSAGGHLVSLLGTTDAKAGFEQGEYLDQSSRVQAVADLYGPADLTPASGSIIGLQLGRVFGTAPGAFEKASPVTYITPDDPPFLILQGDRDQIVPASQSEELNDRLKAAGVPSTLVIVKNAGHGFTPMGGAISPSRADITRMIVAFFDQQLKSA